VRISRIATLILMVASLARPLAQAQSDRAQSEVVLRQLEQDLVEAASQNDWHLWNRLVAPECTFIDLVGRQWDKPATLAKMKNFKGSVLSARLYDVEVRFFSDDVAMVTGIATVTGTGPGSTRVIKVKYRGTDIFVYRAGKWLVSASLATPVKEM